MKSCYKLFVFYPVIFLSTCLLLFTGCASQKSWVYRSEPIAQSPVIIDKSVSVPPFSDNRLNENDNMALMCWIPLMPFGWQNYNTPEGGKIHMNSGIWFWKPNEDIAKAVAEELNASHIFREAFFSFRENEAPLVVRGTINSTYYDSKLFSYGISCFSSYLWLVGLPLNTISNELSLSFSLIDMEKKKGVVLWQKNYSRKISHLSWIYHLRSDFEYSALLKEIMLNVVSDIRSDSDLIKKRLTMQ